MSDATIIFFLSVCIVVLICIVLYQQFAFRTGTQSKLKKISQKLEEIQDTDSDENVMVFTDNKVLIDLAAQINRLLENQRKVKVDFRHSEIASKKMLSNISHDIKTPMTVILGYLEIMRLNGSEENEMLLKVELKAQRVMELINQFFTLAKLEAGDTDIEISKIDVCEACRENVLDFYELLTQQEFQVELTFQKKRSLFGETRMPCSGFCLISFPMLYGMEPMESIWEYSYGQIRNTSILMWWIREKGLIRRLHRMCLSGCLPWRIPETGRYRGTDWG